MNNKIKSSLIVLALYSFFYVGMAQGYESFTDQNWTVFDTRTRLIWQKVEDGAQRLNWAQALHYCETLELDDHTDWRLPNIRELISIVDTSTYNPAVYTAFTSKSSPYWSSTTGRYHGSAWGVHFLYGDDFRGLKTHTYFVRCVRGALE